MDVGDWVGGGKSPSIIFNLIEKKKYNKNIFMIFFYLMEYMFYFKVDFDKVFLFLISGLNTDC